MYRVFHFSSIQRREHSKVRGQGGNEVFEVHRTFQPPPQLIQVLSDSSHISRFPCLSGACHSVMASQRGRRRFGGLRVNSLATPFGDFWGVFAKRAFVKGRPSYGGKGQRKQKSQRGDEGA